MNNKGLKAVDTNVLTRLVVKDDQGQFMAAQDLFRSQQIFVPLTVWLETVWVLSSVYRMDRASIAAALHDLMAFSAVHVESPERLGWAIDRFAAGADFGDMIHVIAARHTDEFLTFDKRVGKWADGSPLSIRTLT